ncbi:MAG: GAF domain-containing protein [Chloroflexi bacterium]|nr:GAF domain-containing protein [Chloroflexota bacterium]
MFAGLGVGHYLILLALALLLPVLAIVAFWHTPGKTPFVSRGELSFPPSPDSSKTNEAILLIQIGGRVEYVNDLARGWFDLHPGETPDLERLLRRTRPAEEFLDLCAKPGQKRLSIGGQLVEATSYLVPGGYAQMLVAMKQVEFSKDISNAGAGASILRLISDFGRDVSASLSLTDVLRAILLNVTQLVASDLLEIKISDPASRRLTPFTLDSSGGSGIQRASLSQFGALTEYTLRQRKPVLLANTKETPPELGELNGKTPVQSYLGIPLLADGDMVGVLELGQLAAETLGAHDLDIVQLIAPQIAYSIRNAILHEEEQKRLSELSGLANLIHTIGASHDYSRLIQRLIQNIAPLLPVDIIGFLLYDEGKRTLEAQSPFQGLPSHITDIYRASVPAHSPADRILLERNLIATRNAANDPYWRELGLQTLAQAASLRESVLAPMISEDRLIGYLQVSNHKGASLEFTDSEIRLIETIARQSAGIIENAVTIEHTRQRALRSDALRRIASLAASNATVDEILRFSIQELARLFQSDIAAVFLRDEGRGELRLHEGSVFGATPDAIAALNRLHMDPAQYRLTVSGSQRPFKSGRLSSDRRVLPGYRPLVAALQVESAVVVPLILREHSLGELMLGSRKAEFFNDYDLQIVSTAAGQIASAIDDASRTSLTDEALRRRVEQLTSLARVSRELNAMTDLPELLNVIHTESLRTARADCGAILLFDLNASADPPPVSLSIGCPHADTFSPLEQQVIRKGESRLIADLAQSGATPVHDGVRALMIVPIISGGKTVGLIHLHSSRNESFDDSTLEVMETLASQASVAIGNVRRYQEQYQHAELLRRRTGILARLSDPVAFLDFEQPLEQSLFGIAVHISETTPFKAVLISVLEPESGLLRRVTGVGFPPETLVELLARKQPLASLQQILKPQFRINRSYFIPIDQSPIIPSDVHMVTLETGEHPQKSSNAWDPDDTLITMLEDHQGNPLGIISVDAPRDGLRPDRAAIEALDIFARQASLLILGHTRLAELRTQVEALTSGIERQQRLLANTQNDLPVLLRKDLDQTIAILNLDQRSQRVRAGLAITESVSRQLDASSALQALARETLTQLGMSVALVAETTAEGPRLTHVMGSIPRATNPEALFGQRNPLRAVLQSGEAILVSTLDENMEWRDAPLLTALRAKSMICLPIKIDKRTVAAMMAISPEPMPAFTSEDLQVYHQIARQTSVILQNISLLNETRRRLQEVNLLLDFSRQLRGLDADHIVKSLLESARRALHAAHAGVVLIWDEHTSQLIPQAVSGYADNEAMKRIAYRSGGSLPGQVFETNRPLRVDEVQFTRDYTFSSDEQLLYRQATGGRLPVASLLIPIQSGDQRVGVIVLDNFNTPAAFREEDEALLLSLAQQVGLSLQNVRLVQTTQERAKQLEALTSAATNLTSSLKSTELVESLLDQLSPIIPYDTATLWIREKDRLTVAAARGFPDTERRLGLTLAVEDSALFKEMIRTGQGILVGDIRQDPRFPSLEAPRLSWLGLPLLSKKEVIGVLALEKWQSYYYTREHVQVGMTFASQSAVALENARLFEDSMNRAAELNERSQRLALLNRFSSSLSGLLDEDKILQLTAQEIQEALNAPRVSVVVFERGDAIWKYSNPKSGKKLPQILPHAPIFHRLHESLGVFTTDAVSAEPDLTPLRDFLGSATQSLLILPFASGANLRALMFVHQNESVRFSLAEIELALTLTNQAAIAIENARLYQSTLQTAERFSILNQASYQISSNLDPEQIYVAVHRAAKRLMPIESFVISLLDDETNEIEGVYLMDDDKRAPITRIPRDQGLSGRVINSGEPLFVRGSENVDELGAVPYGKPDAPRSVIAVPMLLGGRAVGMLSAQSYQPNVYTEDDLQILSTLANQAIVAIQNGRLFNETQRLAQELEQRVIDRTAELQREQQNTETLLRILTEVSSSLDLDRALNRTLALLNDAIGAEQGTIMLRGAEDNMLHYRAGYGYLSDKITGEGRGFKLKVGEGLAGWVVANRESVLIGDLLKDPRWVTTPTSSREHRSAIVVPLLVAEDVIGVLMVFHRKVNFFSAERLNMVKAIAGQVSVAINNAHLYELIRDQAERLGAMLRREQEDASRSQAILEAVADGVLVTGANNRITFLNKSAEDILDLEAGRLIGQTLDVFAGLFGKAAGSWMQTIRAWSEAPSKYQRGETYAEQLDLQNGRIVLVHLAPVILQNDFLGTVSIFRDITHEVEVDRLKSEFVATVSHELRTPMTSIRGYTDVLLMGAAGALNENQTHFLNIIKNNTERLNILVNDLLDVSRIESGRVTLSPQALDLRELAEDVIEDVLRRSQEENKPMALSLDAPRKLPLVYGDMERVRQVLSNLVFNSYHYTPENGTITVYIHPLNDEENPQVQVDVKDNGVGISPEDQERIFERFYRGEHPLVLATPGTGLGLSIVKQIVEMHKGKIWMKSNGIPGEGSVFSFTLPVYQKNEA